MLTVIATKSLDLIVQNFVDMFLGAKSQPNDLLSLAKIAYNVLKWRPFKIYLT